MIMRYDYRSILLYCTHLILENINPYLLLFSVQDRLNLSTDINQRNKTYCYLTRWVFRYRNWWYWFQYWQYCCLMLGYILGLQKVVNIGEWWVHKNYNVQYRYSASYISEERLLKCWLFRFWNSNFFWTSFCACWTR